MNYLFKSRASLDLEMSQQVMNGVEQIITEMGADVHDDLIQKLSILRLYMDRLERSKSSPEELNSVLVNMNAHFQEVVQSVRTISRRLLPTKMKGDSFHRSISVLCQNLERPGGGTIHLEQSGSELLLSEVPEVHLYRIIQELIQNALKHSSAWHIWVRLKWDTDKLTIEVEDDGTGFTRIHEFIQALENKYNTLRMRCNILGASISYVPAQRGLLALVIYSFPKVNIQ